MALSARAAAAAAAAILFSTGATATATSWPTQEPFWPHYTSRNVQVLTGEWSFGFQAEGDPSTLPYASISTPETTMVPSASDVAPPGILGRRGNSFYRSTHACTPGTVSALKFSAANFYARVFADGVDIGNHTAGGYTPFEFVSPPCSASGQRELLVVVNGNQSSALSPTFTGGDFYFFSGLIRPVIVTELPPAPYWIQTIHILSRDYVRGLVDIRVVFAGNLTQAATNNKVHLAYAFNNATLGSSDYYALVNGSAIIPNVAVPNFSLWTPGQNNLQNLFTVTVQEGYSKDTVTTRSGLRVLGIDENARVTFNGKAVKLRGFNRHTLWPDTGAAVTPAQEQADMAVLLEVNANYVRGAHYPQSQSWLDLCDENGIVMWEETLGPGVSTQNTEDPWFMLNHLTAVNSMVMTSLHHPSVAFHGFFNEGPSNDYSACAGYSRSADAIHAWTAGYPPQRLVTWASNQVSADVCFEYADVLSFNSYPAWYDHPGNISYIPTFWGEKVQWAMDNWPDKPLLISETGGAGIWEWVNASAPYPGVFWSQTFQTNVVTTDASFLLNQSHVSGLTIWQFCDIKANDASTEQCGQCDYAPTGGYPTGNLSIPWDCAYISASCGRPGGENHKGVVDMWRRKKAEFGPMAAIYAAANEAN